MEKNTGLTPLIRVLHPLLQLQVDVDESERPKSDAGGTEGLAGALARALAGRAQKLNTGLYSINFLQKLF